VGLLFFKFRQALLAVLGQNDFVAFFRKLFLVQAKEAQVIINAKDLFHGDLLSAVGRKRRVSTGYIVTQVPRGPRDKNQGFFPRQ
jgi:hypothetical protein